MESDDVWFIKFYGYHLFLFNYFFSTLVVQFLILSIYILSHHCKILAPEFEKMAELLDGVLNVHIGAVNTQTEGAIANDFNIEGYPTLLFFGLKKSDPIPFRKFEFFINYVRPE